MPTLNFIGKDKVSTYNPPFHILDKKYNFGGKTQNKIIHGDNLLALKSLLPEFEGKIKCIYIDPPYNTGNENWIYNDNVNAPQIKKWLGQVVGKEGEDLTRHDKWLCMMYPRLKLLKKLLADDGAIFISIDDNEQANLKLICDEIFGINNFLAELIWKKKYTGGKGTKTFVDYHEYILAYAANISEIGEISMDRPESEKAKFTQEDEYIEERGKYYTRPLKSNLDPRPTLVYPIELPDGTSVTTQWICAKSTYEELLRDGRIEFKNPRSSKYPVYKKFYEKDDGGKVKIPSILETTSNNDAKEELKSIFNINSTRDLIFKTPKPTKLIDIFVRNFTKKNSIVLDSFAGSGTTAHAVLNLNQADGGERKFILVEMEDYAEKITAERVRRVGGSFDFYEIGEKVFDDEDNLNENLDAEKIREYIWFTETGTKYEKISGENKYYLGEFEGTGIYFNYEKDSRTYLDIDFLATIKIRAENYLIYADECLLSREQLGKYKIVFKKIPRDIKKI